MTQKQALEKMIDSLERDLLACQKDLDRTGKEVYRQIIDTLKFHLQEAKHLLDGIKIPLSPKITDQEQREADEFCHKLAQELAKKREASNTKEIMSDKTIIKAEFLEWLEKYPTLFTKSCLNKARFLFVEEKAYKKYPYNDGSLIEELNQFVGLKRTHGNMMWVINDLKEILLRYKSHEPLAVLLIKNAGGNTGFHVHQWIDEQGDIEWTIESAGVKTSAKTYAEAESKIRKYLEELSDK